MSTLPSKLGSGSLWSGSPDELEKLNKFIYNSIIYKTVKDMLPHRIELDFECVG